MFGRHRHLVILHNMGKSCPNCALWGDEFNGMLKHLEKVAGFCEDQSGKAQPGVSILDTRDGLIQVVKQVNVMRDTHCLSVLEVFWMLPGVETSDVAWAKS